jgi:hypothetical protein
MRERGGDTVEELKRRNVTLEQQVRFLQNGTGVEVRRLLETVNFVEDRNRLPS